MAFYTFVSEVSPLRWLVMQLFLSLHFQHIQKPYDLKPLLGICTSTSLWKTSNNLIKTPETCNLWNIWSVKYFQVDMSLLMEQLSSAASPVHLKMTHLDFGSWVSECVTYDLDPTRIKMKFVQVVIHWRIQKQLICLRMSIWQLSLATALTSSRKTFWTDNDTSTSFAFDIQTCFRGHNYLWCCIVILSDSFYPHWEEIM